MNAKGLSGLVLLCAVGCEDSPMLGSVPTSRATAPASVPGRKSSAAHDIGALHVAARRVHTMVIVKTLPDEAALTGYQAELEKRFPKLKVVTQPGKPPASSVAMVLREPSQVVLPAAELMARRAHGLDKERLARLPIGGGVALNWELASDDDLSAYKAADAFALEIARAHDGLILDMVTTEIYAPAAWARARVASWQGDVPYARDHVRAEYVQDRSLLRTRGMQKLGLPDLAIANVPHPEAPRAAALMYACIQLMVEGSRHTRGVFECDMEAIRHDIARKSVQRATRKRERLRITLRKAAPRENDPDNRVLELHFPSFPGASPSERVTAALVGAFGPAVDPTTWVGALDPELAAVKVRVQAELPALSERYQKGVPAGEHMSVKVPFEAHGHVERMWVVVTAWNDATIEGTLNSEPQLVQNLKAGAPVTFAQSEVTDYAWWKADGSREGGESIDVLMRR